MFMELLSRLFEFLVIVWLVRFLLKNLIGGVSGAQKFRQSQSRGPFSSPFGSPYGSSFGAPFGSNDQAPSPSAHTVVTGEMKKDPQCGTYVSTELSLKSKIGNEVLHFCSRQCQEEFLKAHSGKPA